MMTTDEQRQFQDLLASFSRSSSGRQRGGRSGRGRGGGAAARKRAADGPISVDEGKRVR